MTRIEKRAAAVRRLIDQAFTGQLDAAGFARVGRTMQWRRETPELTHVVELGGGRRTQTLTWGVVDSEAAGVLFDVVGDPRAVRYAVMSGYSGSVHHPPNFSVIALDDGMDDADVDSIGTGVRVDLERVVDFLDAFAARRDLVTYLVEVDEPLDRRGFLVPTAWALKLLFIAAVAACGEFPEAGDRLEAARRHPLLAGPNDIVRLDRIAQRIRESRTD